MYLCFRKLRLMSEGVQAGTVDDAPRYDLWGGVWSRVPSFSTPNLR